MVVYRQGSSRSPARPRPGPQGCPSSCRTGCGWRSCRGRIRCGSRRWSRRWCHRAESVALPADLPGAGSGGHAQRMRWAGHVGAGATGQGSAQRRCLRVRQQAPVDGQDPGLGCVWVLAGEQAAGAGHVRGWSAVGVAVGTGKSCAVGGGHHGDPRGDRVPVGSLPSALCPPSISCMHSIYRRNRCGDVETSGRNRACQR